MRSVSRRAWLTLLLFLSVSFAVPGANAEVYRWTDTNGNIRFTQDLGQVPVDQRPGAKLELEKLKRTRAIQTYDAPSPPARRAPTATAKSSSLSTSSGRIHRIRVAKTGNSLRVMVRLNNTLNVPFLIDTGASDVVVPIEVARQLGIAVEGKGVRTQRYSTANGIVESAQIRLDSVSLGTARALNVAASVSDSMSVGLLGLTFFQHFDYQVYPGKGLVILTENNLEEEGLIRGGRSEAQWRAQFTGLRRRVEKTEARIEDIAFSRTRKRERAEVELERHRAHFEILENEADDAHVPFAWRE